MIWPLPDELRTYAAKAVYYGSNWEKQWESGEYEADQRSHVHCENIALAVLEVAHLYGQRPELKAAAEPAQEEGGAPQPSPWRPIAEYPITPDPDGAMGPIVLARDSNRFPLLVVMQCGHFYVVPGIPIMVGLKNGPSMMTVANLVDFMPLPD